MAYYFFDFNDSEKQTLRGVLLSLLEQLSKARTRMSASLKSLYTECKYGQRLPDTAGLKETIISVLNEYSKEDSKHVFVILDALDECKEAAAVLDFIENLHKIHPCVRIYIASRPERDIMLKIETLKASKIILSAINGSDIEVYVREELERRPRLQRAQQNTKERIQNTLVEKASGM